MTTPPTEQQLDEHEAAARNAARIGSGIDPAAVLELAAALRRLRVLLPGLASRWEQMADQGDAAVGHFEGPAAAILDAEVGERGRTYRKSAADVRAVLASGRIPHDLMTDAESRAEQNTTPAPPVAPLAASQPSEVPTEPETATGGRVGDFGARDTPPALEPHPTTTETGR